MAFARARGAVRFGTVAAAVLMSGLTGGLTALPAQAAGSASFTAFVNQPEATLPPQSSGAPAQRFHQVGVVVLADQPLTGVTVTVDASKAAGVVELSLPAHCAYTDGAKLHARCDVGAVATMDQFTVGLRSAAGAALGAKGTVGFAVTAANGTLDPQTGPLTSTVTVGSGPDLAVGALPGTMDVRTGQATPVSPTVQNLGDQPASGVTLILDTSYPPGYAFGGDHSNCLYGGKASVVCHFDTVVQPGQTYGLASPVALTPGAQAQDGAVLMYGWDVKGGTIEQEVAGGTPGKGAPLTLVPTQRSAFARTQTDIDDTNNLGVSELHLITPDDVAVVAPRTITGTVGHTVAATFGVRNTGSVPTRPIDGAPADVTAAVLVILPKGVSVATLPKDCERLDTTTTGSGVGPSGNLRGLVARGLGAQALASALGAGDPPPATDGTPYGCVVRRVLQPGRQADFTFSLKPTKVLKQAYGLAVAVGQQNDNNPRDNIAAFTVTATKAAPVPSASATPTRTHVPAPSASPSGPSGGLAHTGGGSAALPLAASGAGAIALGAGALLLTRRRRNAGRRS